VLSRASDLREQRDEVRSRRDPQQWRPEVKLTDRREFNKWYVETFADSDHRFTHLPSWLKADLWLAWQAGRAAIREGAK
jgi:hypothetical protein